MTVNVLDERLKEKLVAEFNHLRINALEPLATFLDYIKSAAYLICCLSRCAQVVAPVNVRTSIADIRT